MGIAPAMLAFTFGIHIALVNLGIGLSWLVPYLKWKADRGEKEFEPIARELMRFYAATYGFAGVFGTAYTVFLLSYYPHFIGLAGHITLVPFGIAIIFIVVHFFSISAYWYGWDRWSRGIHHVIGLALGISALLIPLGFRAVFAFLNIPAGLGFDTSTGKVYLDVWSAIAKNPTYPALYVKSIAAAFTATLLAVGGAYLYSASRGGDNAEAKLRLARQALKAGAIGLALMVPLGLWYALTLRAIPYKFNNIFASLHWRVGDGTAYYDVSWLFILKMLLLALQAVALAYVLPRIRDRLSGSVGTLALIAGIAALLTIICGEYLNAFSQYPFFIAIWPDVLRGAVPVSSLASYGISIPEDALPSVVNAVNKIVLLESSPSALRVLDSLGITGYYTSIHAVNTIAVTTPVVTITIVFLAALLAASTLLFHVLLTGGSAKYH